jgi:hypothetical protein
VVTGDAAQAVLDEATDALVRSPLVAIDVRRTAPGGFNGEPLRQTARGDWFPEQDALTAVAEQLENIGTKRVPLFTQTLVIDGQVYMRQSLTMNFRGPWDNLADWIDPADTSPTTGWWSIGEIVDSMVASNATSDGEATTIVGRIPTDLAIDVFGLSDSDLIPSVQKVLADGTTMVTMRVVDGYPRSLVIEGSGVGVPPEGVPTLALAVLGNASLELRFEPDQNATPPRAPRPEQITKPQPAPTPDF